MNTRGNFGADTEGFDRFVHDHGSCHDTSYVDAVVDDHGGSGRLRDEIARHAARCPSPSEALGHELDLTRFFGFDDDFVLAGFTAYR